MAARIGLFIRSSVAGLSPSEKWLCVCAREACLCRPHNPATRAPQENRKQVGNWIYCAHASPLSWSISRRCDHFLGRCADQPGRSLGQPKICGNQPALGNWSLASCPVLRDDDGDGIYSVTLSLSDSALLEYKGPAQRYVGRQRGAGPGHLPGRRGSRRNDTQNIQIVQPDTRGPATFYFDPRSDRPQLCNGQRQPLGGGLADAARPGDGLPRAGWSSETSRIYTAITARRRRFCRCARGLGARITAAKALSTGWRWKVMEGRPPSPASTARVAGPTPLRGWLCHRQQPGQCRGQRVLPPARARRTNADPGCDGASRRLCQRWLPWLRDRGRIWGPTRATWVARFPTPQLNLVLTPAPTREANGGPASTATVRSARRPPPAHDGHAGPLWGLSLLLLRIGRRRRRRQRPDRTAGAPAAPARRAAGFTALVGVCHR